MVEQSENPSPPCPFEAAPSASAVVYRDPTKSRQDFSGSGIWEGPSGTGGAGSCALQHSVKILVGNGVVITPGIG